MLLNLLLRFVRPYRGLLWTVVALQLVSTLMSLYLPTLNAHIIDEGISQGDTAFILRTGGWMLLVSLFQIAAMVAAAYFSSRLAMGVGRDLRASLFSSVTDWSALEMARFGAPTLISRTTNDVTQVQMLLFMTLVMLVSAPISMIGGVIMALRQDVGLSWLIVVAVPLLIVCVGWVIRQMLPQFQKMQDAIDGVNRVLREQITGVRVVRAFVREQTEAERFAEANRKLTNTALAVGRLQALIGPTIGIILNVSTVAVLWFGAGRVENGEMQVGALTAFMAYLMQILMSVMMATFMSMMIPRASVSAGRIQEVLSTTTSLTPPAHPVTERPAAPSVEFRDVSFTFPGAEKAVLEGLNFTARLGQTTAVIGSTGAGKTTLLSLIPRLYDVTSGRVLYGGVDVRDLAPETLWAGIGLVPQKAFLFSGTVASNLRFGRPEATDEELWDALRIAQADGFVREMEGGLEATITQGGSNVSGGQRQRLAMARAIVRRPDVYLFDDAFSALDVATDARLRRALKPVTLHATVIVVAQRVSTIQDADQIVVLDNGRIVGIGTHDELLIRCPTYAEIVESQRAAEVAA